MAIITGAPPQLSSDTAGNVTAQTTLVLPAQDQVMQVVTLPALTPGGTAGSVTFVNGVQTAYTAPT